MEIITKSSKKRHKTNGQVPQLLDSPLPTPRRSCGSVDTLSMHRFDASPLRTQVPFSWESSPGVPKNSEHRENACSDKEQEILPPKPPPGRWPPCHVRNYYGNTSEASSDDGNDDTFSDALDKISSSERLGGLCGRLSSFDGLGSRRFEDIVNRAPSFIMDRFLPAANAIATSSAGKHPKQSPRRTTPCKHDEAAAPVRHAKHSPRQALACEHEERPAPRQSNDTIQVQLGPRINIEAQGDQMSPRACGLMVFFPWSLKPVLCGFKSPARCRTPRAGASAAPSPHRTLGDVLDKENKGNGDLYDVRRSNGKEWPSPGWGLSFLDTGKKYCIDARKALSRLALGGTENGSPRISRERRNGKQGISPLRAVVGKLPQLKPPSESWLAHARDSVNKKR